MRLIDTHCHIDLDAFEEDRTEVIRRAFDAGVENMLVIGFDPERWRAAEALASAYPEIRVAAGLHPTSAERFNSDVLNDIANQVSRPEVIAIGETGIDLYWDAASLESQQCAFRAQIDLAKDLGVPFIVHQREAENEVLEVLKAAGGPHKGVMHCFTGDWDYAKEILDLGMHIGLGGAITFKSRTDLHHAASQIPIDRIVLETDSPYMAPAPHRGKRNEPAYVRLVAERLAQLRGVCVQTIAEATTCNARMLFAGIGN